MDTSLFWYTLCLGAVLNNVSGDKHKKKHKRVIAGQSVKIEEYPYYVLIRVSRGPCGGSLIATDKVLTATHCVHKKSYKFIKSVPGLIDFTQVNKTKNYDTKDVFSKPGYKFPNNDVSVIQLTEHVTLGPTIQVINLSLKPAMKNNEVTIVGYGDNVCDLDLIGNCLSTIPKYLQMAKLTVLRIEDQQVTYDSGNATDACNGDSGGPVTIDKLQYVVHNAGYKGCKGETSGVNVAHPDIIPFLKQYATYV